MDLIGQKLVSVVDFHKTVTLMHGVKGEAWLKDLPNLQSELAKRWNLRDLTVCDSLSINYVAFGWQNKTPIILKIGVDQAEIAREYAAINAFKGHGVVTLLDEHFALGAILITRAVPGQTLCTLFPKHDAQALEIACQLISTIHQVPIPTDHKFPFLSEWLSIIDQDWDLPTAHLQLARQLKSELLNTTADDVLLHGDVHYANILSNADTWIMIDPKGVIGPALYDITGCLLREPLLPVMQHGNVDKLLSTRMEFVAKYTNTPLHIIWAWTLVQTVMSVCWALEDCQDATLMKEFLDIVASMRPN